MKIVACHFVSRFHPDSSLLVWAGALEYKGVQSVSCGAKAGLPADDLITEAIKNILCRLKEPVAIRLIASPALSDNVFGLLTTGRLDLRFSRERGADPYPGLFDRLCDVERFAVDVLAQQKEMAVLGAFVDGLGSADECISIRDVDGAGYQLDCHRGLFEQKREQQLSLGD